MNYVGQVKFEPDISELVPKHLEKQVVQYSSYMGEKGGYILYLALNNGEIIKVSSDKPLIRKSLSFKFVKSVFVLCSRSGRTKVAVLGEESLVCLCGKDLATIKTLQNVHSAEECQSGLSSFLRIRFIGKESEDVVITDFEPEAISGTELSESVAGALQYQLNLSKTSLTNALADVDRLSEELEASFDQISSGATKESKLIENALGSHQCTRLAFGQQNLVSLKALAEPYLVEDDLVIALSACNKTDRDLRHCTVRVHLGNSSNAAFSVYWPNQSLECGKTSNFFIALDFKSILQHLGQFSSVICNIRLNCSEENIETRGVDISLGEIRQLRKEIPRGCYDSVRLIFHRISFVVNRESEEFSGEELENLISKRLNYFFCSECDLYFQAEFQSQLNQTAFACETILCPSSLRISFWGNEIQRRIFVLTLRNSLPEYYTIRTENEVSGRDLFQYLVSRGCILKEVSRFSSALSELSQEGGRHAKKGLSFHEKQKNLKQSQDIRIMGAKYKMFKSSLAKHEIVTDEELKNK